MSHLYITESNLKIGLSNGQIHIRNLTDETERTLPFCDIDGISLFGKPQLSTQLIRECIAKNIPIVFYSDDGHYFGNINSSERIDPLRQKKQILLTDNAEFCLRWSKRIIWTKIHNSIALLKLMENVYELSEAEMHGLLHSAANLGQAQSVEAVLGFEGNAAKCYFQCLSKLLVNEDFVFSGRSSRPPLDAFNSMLSYGYSLLFRNIIGAIERHGLHPYFAYMHKLKFGHAALASDLIEEYRAPIIDKTVIELINTGEIEIADFYRNEAGAIYMQKHAQKKYTDTLSQIIAKSEKYFYDNGDKKSYGFQVALDKKIIKLIEAIECQDAGMYLPYVWKPIKSTVDIGG